MDGLQEASVVAGAILIGLLLLAIALHGRSYLREIALLKEMADAQFRATVVPGAAGRSGFNGRLAEVLQESESRYMASRKNGNYTLTRLARMPDGSHFIFKSSVHGRPYVSAIANERVNYLLGKQAPGQESDA